MNNKNSKDCKPTTRIWTWLSKLIPPGKIASYYFTTNASRFASLCLYLFLCSCPMYYISLRTSACLSVCMILCYLTERFTSDEQPQQQQKWWRHISLQKKEMLRKKVVCFVWKSVVLCCCYCCIRQRQRRRCCCFFYVMDFSGVVVLLLEGGDSFKRILSLPIRNSSQDIRKKREFLQPAMNSMEQLQLSSFGVLLFRPSFRPNVVRNPHHMIWPFSLRFDQHNRDC